MERAAVPSQNVGVHPRAPEKQTRKWRRRGRIGAIGLMLMSLIGMLEWMATTHERDGGEKRYRKPTRQRWVTRAGQGEHSRRGCRANFSGRRVDGQDRARVSENGVVILTEPKHGQARVEDRDVGRHILAVGWPSFASHQFPIVEGGSATRRIACPACPGSSVPARWATVLPSGEVPWSAVAVMGLSNLVFRVLHVLRSKYKYILAAIYIKKRLKRA
jgi:hypothetical protein